MVGNNGDFVIKIERLIQYFKDDTVLITHHAAERFRQRGIKMKDIRCGIFSGKIIEQYPEDSPFPSCLVLGYACDHRPIHIVMSDERTASRIITAYIPDPEKWELNWETRKE